MPDTSDPQAAYANGPQYATAAQKTELLRLVNQQPPCTPAQKTKVLRDISKITEARASELIAQFTPAAPLVATAAAGPVLIQADLDEIRAALKQADVLENEWKASPYDYNLNASLDADEAAGKVLLRHAPDLLAHIDAQAAELTTLRARAEKAETAKEAAGVLSEREREPYLAAIEHGKPRLGDWNYPDMLKRLLAGYDAQVAEAARLRERNAMLGGALDDEKRAAGDLVKELKSTRAKLNEEADAEAQLLLRDEELRKLRGAWVAVADELPNTWTPVLVAAPAPSEKGRVITLRRTFLHAGNGVFGVHGKMESERNDITHWRYLPAPPTISAAPALQGEGERGKEERDA